MTKPQSCRSCRWFSLVGVTVGTCSWPLPPIAKSYQYPALKRGAVFADDGQSCPTWEPAETESRT